MSQIRRHHVWDATTRWFHWINVFCVAGLAAIGIVIMNAGGLDISNAGKVTLKTAHVWIGYVFSLNLLWRLIWAFIGGPHARWRAGGVMAALSASIWGPSSPAVRSPTSAITRPAVSPSAFCSSCSSCRR